jgi:hypothetical protein
VIISILSKLTEEQYPVLRAWARRWITVKLERTRLRATKPELLSDPQKS